MTSEAWERAAKEGLLAGLAEAEHVSITTDGVTYVGFPAGTLGTFVAASLAAAIPIVVDEALRARIKQMKEMG